MSSALLYLVLKNDCQYAYWSITFLFMISYFSSAEKSLKKKKDKRQHFYAFSNNFMLHVFVSCYMYRLSTTLGISVRRFELIVGSD